MIGLSKVKIKWIICVQWHWVFRRWEQFLVTAQFILKVVLYLKVARGLDENLNIKVSDFGFATFIEHDEELTELMGTPAYLSPEVLKCSMSMGGIEGYGRPTDVWACGVVMYTLLSGQPPFWHRKQMMMLRMIMEAR